MDYEADEILDALDDEQREAAQSLLGPTVILAGAGTGKTRTLIALHMEFSAVIFQNTE